MCFIEDIASQAPWDGLDLDPVVSKNCSPNTKHGGNNLQAGSLETDSVPSQLLFQDKHGDYFLNNFIVSIW